MEFSWILGDLPNLRTASLETALKFFWKKVQAQHQVLVKIFWQQLCMYTYFSMHLILQELD